MAKQKLNSIKPLRNENSYTPEFFDELCEKIQLKDGDARAKLEHSIISAGKTYLRWRTYYKTELPPHEINKQLQIAIEHINKAEIALKKVYESGNYNKELINGLWVVISEKYRSLCGVLNEVRKETKFSETIYPEKSTILLSSMRDSIQWALKNYKLRRTTPKSRTLNHWLVVLSYELEPIVGRSFEQGHYHKTKTNPNSKINNKGEYISKRKIGDSEFLHSIIKIIDPKTTISQIETSIKETRKERKDQQDNRSRNYLFTQWVLAT